MIAIALIPGIDLAGMALAAAAIARWLLDAVCVVAASTAILAIKQKLIHRRRSLG